MARRDVEEAELVGAGRVIGLGGLDRIAGVAQVDELHAFDDAPVLHVEAGDEPDLQHAAMNSLEIVGTGQHLVESEGAGLGKGRLSQARFGNGITPGSPVGKPGGFVEPRLETRIGLKDLRGMIPMPIDGYRPTPAAQIGLVLPFEHVEHDKSIEAHQLVELIAPQALDLLGDILPIDGIEATGTQ
jgi:hypothetical protein